MTTTNRRHEVKYDQQPVSLAEGIQRFMNALIIAGFVVVALITLLLGR